MQCGAVPSPRRRVSNRTGKTKALRCPRLFFGALQRHPRAPERQVSPRRAWASSASALDFASGVEQPNAQRKPIEVTAMMKQLATPG
jgi:hypothetical protein